MLDEIFKVAMAELELTSKDVQKIREALAAEVLSGEGRYAARTALEHPEGSTTPLTEAADRAQQTYAKMREKLMKTLPSLVALMLGEQVARQRRDEAVVARDRHWDAERERREVGPHPETRDLFARLFDHGVTPWQLKNLRNEETAVLADLIRWKAHDPRFKDADNPWRALLQSYAGRLIVRARNGVTVARSKPGTPVRGTKHTSPSYYMFNEMVDPLWDLPSGTIEPTTVQEEKGEIPTKDDKIKNSREASDVSTENSVIETVDQRSLNSSEPLVASRDPLRPQEHPVFATEAVGLQLNPDQARALAEEVFRRDPAVMGSFWPRDIDQGDFEPCRLIAALERMVAEHKDWPFARDFLDAAQRGEGRTFFVELTECQIRNMAIRLENGLPRAVAQAQRLGVLPKPQFDER